MLYQSRNFRELIASFQFTSFQQFFLGKIDFPLFVSSYRPCSQENSFPFGGFSYSNWSRIGFPIQIGSSLAAVLFETKLVTPNSTKMTKENYVVVGACI